MFHIPKNKNNIFILNTHLVFKLNAKPTFFQTSYGAIGSEPFVEPFFFFLLLKLILLNVYKFTVKVV